MMQTLLPRIIGLTGGIATGKTTVSDYLARQYGFTVLDADLYAREAVEPGSPVLEAIAQRYGEDLLLPDGSLHRQQLGELIFRDAKERQWVEAQIHPYVRSRFETAITMERSQPIVLAVPLLFEANMTDLVTEIWVVVCTAEQQIERLMQRNGLSQEQAQTRINVQMSLEDKSALADVVLDNSGSIADLQKQIDIAVTLSFL